MGLEKWKVADIKPYENNPRKNADAVEAVKESIRQCGYVAPIVVDENGVVLAGHTRLKALQELEVQECDVLVKTEMSEEQKKKYRLLDNKTNEFAGWDFEKLEKELEGLDFGDFDFGLEQKDIDLSMIDELLTDAPEKEKEAKKIQCPHCGEWFEVE